MEPSNPTYLIEHCGPQLRITVTHHFTAEERVSFTVLAPSGPESLANLHATAFGKLRELLAHLP